MLPQSNPQVIPVSDSEFSGADQVNAEANATIHDLITELQRRLPNDLINDLISQLVGINALIADPRYKPSYKKMEARLYKFVMQIVNNTHQINKIEDLDIQLNEIINHQPSLKVKFFMGLLSVLKKFVIYTAGATLAGCVLAPVVGVPVAAGAIIGGAVGAGTLAAHSFFNRDSLDNRIKNLKQPLWKLTPKDSNRILDSTGHNDNNNNNNNNNIMGYGATGAKLP